MWLILWEQLVLFVVIWPLQQVSPGVKTKQHPVRQDNSKSIFEEHGIASKLVTGNDTQFTSALFQEFRETYGTNLLSMSKPSLSLSVDGDINTKLQARQNQQKSLYDKSSKTLPATHSDDPVRVLNPHNHKREPGIVKCSTHSSSLIFYHGKWSYP